jgi:nucleotide-binding universal stress UspA family protein
MEAWTTPQLIEIHKEALDRRATQATYAFNGIPRELRERSRFIQEEADGLDLLVRYGRYADLVVLGQTSPSEGESTDFDLPADAVMSLGRPVLIVPYAGAFEAVGRRVLIAWNSSRESARAVADALPYIRGAESVTALTANAAGDGEGEVLKLKAYLERHGIKADTRSEHTEELEIEDLLLSRASDFAADLIVMGAYGRARFRELILGGATHGILKQMTVPVLMSH